MHTQHDSLGNVSLSTANTECCCQGLRLEDKDKDLSSKDKDLQIGSRGQDFPQEHWATTQYTDYYKSSN